MKWDAVIEAMQSTCLADPFLSAIYGTSIRYIGAGKLVAPVLEFSLIANAETELWEPTTVQLDQWTLNLPDLLLSERVLRRKFHRDLPFAIAGLKLWGQYNDGEVLSTPGRDGFHGRAIRFRMTPLREQYNPAAPVS